MLMLVISTRAPSIWDDHPLELANADEVAAPKQFAHQGPYVQRLVGLRGGPDTGRTSTEYPPKALVVIWMRSLDRMCCN